MDENIFVDTHLTKNEKYQSLLPQISHLLEGEEDMIANMANVCAALKTTFDHLWIGFYLVKNDVLVLGPFQGPVACTRIGYGKGVCGSAWKEKRTIVVPDVDAFPGHIACSSASKSEIVVPGIVSDNVIFVLDVDSDQYDTFDAIDEDYLQKIVSLLV